MGHVKDAHPVLSSTAIFPQFQLTAKSNPLEPDTGGLAPVASLIGDEEGPGCGAMQRALLSLQRLLAIICAG